MTITPTITDLRPAWESWHNEREAALAVPHGWLSLTGFHWLPEAAAELPGLPGRWRADAAGAELIASAQDGLAAVEHGVDGVGRGTGGGTGVEGALRAEVAEAGSTLWVRHGDRVVELVRRGGRYAVRVRDPRAPGRQQFRGVPAFPVDPAWVLDATWTPYPEPVPTTVPTARADLDQQVLAVGEVTVEIAGMTTVLIATGSVQAPLVAFHDATNGDSTAAWRVVPVAFRSGDAPAAVTLDFNRAVNQPFAFSDFGTCPAPIAGNTLPVAVTAGEQTPAGRG